MKRLTEEKEKQLVYLEGESKALLEAIRFLRKVPSSRPAPMVVQIEGWNNIQAMLIQLLKEAESFYWGTSKPPDWKDLTTLGINQPRRLSDWYEAIDVRGVDVRWLTSLEAIPSYIGYVQAMYLPRRFILDERIPKKYVIVDGSKVLINLRDPETGTYNATAILIESPSVSKVFEHHFITLWNEASPPDGVMKEKNIERKVESVCAKLRKAGFKDLDVRVYASLLRIGASTIEEILADMRWSDKKEIPSETSLKKALRRLVRGGIVERHPVLGLYLPKDLEKVEQLLFG